MQVEEANPLVHYDAPAAPAPNPGLFRLIVDQGPDAVVFANHQGKIHIWNNAAAELFGYLRNEAIGQSLDIIISDHLRQAHWKGFRTAMASGHTKHGKRALRTKAIHKDGRKLYVSLAFSIVKDQEGVVIGAVATARESKEKSDPEWPLPRDQERKCDDVPLQGDCICGDEQRRYRGDRP